MVAAETSSATKSAASPARLQYLDNLRVLLISLIVLLHLAITYGAPGDWYIHEVDTGDLGMGSLIAFTLYNATVQAFALGFFFFLSGYFTASSLERKGPRLFLKDRLIRLGIPLLAYTFVLNPITIYLYYRPSTIGYFLRDQFLGLQFSTGPMWFVAALLLFTLIYMALQMFRNPGPDTAVNRSSRPQLSLLFILTAGTGVMAFIIRFMYHVGWSVPVLNFQLGYFAEYIVTFFLGTVAWHIRWFDRPETYRAPVWLTYTAAVVALMPVMLIASGAEGGISPFEGGMHWQALAYAMWEPFVCIGMIIGLSSLFAKRLNGHGRLAGMLAPNAYGVYVIHPQILIVLTVVCAGISLPPLTKFAVMAPLTLAACFATAMVIRAIPGMKRIL